MQSETPTCDLGNLPEEIEFERSRPVQRLLARAVLNPLANYLPAALMRSILRFAKSELAAANWADPVGGRSMVIGYECLTMQVHLDGENLDHALTADSVEPAVTAFYRAEGLHLHSGE